VYNFDQVSREVCKKDAVDACLRAKVFLSSKANFDIVKDGLRAKFQGIPVVVIRVSNLPKYALIELEMFMDSDKANNTTH